VKIQKPFNGFYIVDSPASLSGKSGMGIPKGFIPRLNSAKGFSAGWWR